jgi:hypothetical protein
MAAEPPYRFRYPRFARSVGTIPRARYRYRLSASRQPLADADEGRHQQNRVVAQAGRCRVAHGTEDPLDLLQGDGAAAVSRTAAHARHSVCQVGGCLPGPEQVAEEVSQLRRHGLVAQRPQDGEPASIQGRIYPGRVSRGRLMTTSLEFQHPHSIGMMPAQLPFACRGGPWHARLITINTERRSAYERLYDVEPQTGAGIAVFYVGRGPAASVGLRCGGWFRSSAVPAACR